MVTSDSTLTNNPILEVRMDKQWLSWAENRTLSQMAKDLEEYMWFGDAEADILRSKRSFLIKRLLKVKMPYKEKRSVKQMIKSPDEEMIMLAESIIEKFESDQNVK